MRVGRADRILPGCPQRLIGEGGACVLGDVPVEVNQRIAADGSVYPLVGEIAESILYRYQRETHNPRGCDLTDAPHPMSLTNEMKKPPLVCVNCRDLTIEVDLCGGFSSGGAGCVNSHTPIPASFEASPSEKRDLSVK
jgi:hypothetical protein